MKRTPEGESKVPEIVGREALGDDEHTRHFSAVRLVMRVLCSDQERRPLFTAETGVLHLSRTGAPINFLSSVKLVVGVSLFDVRRVSRSVLKWATIFEATCYLMRHRMS